MAPPAKSCYIVCNGPLANGGLASSSVESMVGMLGGGCGIMVPDRFGAQTYEKVGVTKPSGEFEAGGKTAVVSHARRCLGSGSGKCTVTETIRGIALGRVGQGVRFFLSVETMPTDVTGSPWIVKSSIPNRQPCRAYGTHIFSPGFNEADPQASRYDSDNECEFTATSSGWLNFHSFDTSVKVGETTSERYELVCPSDCGGGNQFWGGFSLTVEECGRAAKQRGFKFFSSRTNHNSPRGTCVLESSCDVCANIRSYNGYEVKEMTEDVNVVPAYKAFNGRCPGHSWQAYSGRSQNTASTHPLRVQACANKCKRDATLAAPIMVNVYNVQTGQCRDSRGRYTNYQPVGSTSLAALKRSCDTSSHCQAFMWLPSRNYGQLFGSYSLQHSNRGNGASRITRGLVSSTADNQAACHIKGQRRQAVRFTGFSIHRTSGQCMCEAQKAREDSNRCFDAATARTAGKSTAAGFERYNFGAKPGASVSCPQAYLEVVPREAAKGASVAIPNSALQQCVNGRTTTTFVRRCHTKWHGNEVRLAEEGKTVEECKAMAERAGSRKFSHVPLTINAHASPEGTPLKPGACWKAANGAGCHSSGRSGAAAYEIVRRDENPCQPHSGRGIPNINEAGKSLGVASASNSANRAVNGQRFAAIVDDPPGLRAKLVCTQDCQATGAIWGAVIFHRGSSLEECIRGAHAEGYPFVSHVPLFVGHWTSGRCMGKPSCTMCGSEGHGAKYRGYMIEEVRVPVTVAVTAIANIGSSSASSNPMTNGRKLFLQERSRVPRKYCGKMDLNKLEAVPMCDGDCDGAVQQTMKQTLFESGATLDECIAAADEQGLPYANHVPEFGGGRFAGQCVGTSKCSRCGAQSHEKRWQGFAIRQQATRPICDRFCLPGSCSSTAGCKQIRNVMGYAACESYAKAAQIPFFSVGKTNRICYTMQTCPCTGPADYPSYMTGSSSALVSKTKKHDLDGGMLVQRGDKIRWKSGKIVDFHAVPSNTCTLRRWRAIQLTGANCLSIQSGTSLYQTRCNPSNRNQQWSYDVESGLLHNVGGHCLEATGRNNNMALRTAECDEEQILQLWDYNPVTLSIENQGGICLGGTMVSHPSRNGRVQMSTCNANANNQKWMMYQHEHVKSNYRSMPGQCRDDIGNFPRWQPVVRTTVDKMRRLCNANPGCQAFLYRDEDNYGQLFGASTYKSPGQENSQITQGLIRSGSNAAQDKRGDCYIKVAGHQVDHAEVARQQCAEKAQDAKSSYFSWRPTFDFRVVTTGTCAGIGRGWRTPRQAGCKRFAESEDKVALVGAVPGPWFVKAFTGQKCSGGQVLAFNGDGGASTPEGKVRACAVACKAMSTADYGTLTGNCRDSRGRYMKWRPVSSTSDAALKALCEQAAGCKGYWFNGGSGGQLFGDPSYPRSGSGASEITRGQGTVGTCNIKPKTFRGFIFNPNQGRGQCKCQPWGTSGRTCVRSRDDARVAPERASGWSRYTFTKVAAHVDYALVTGSQAGVCTAGAVNKRVVFDKTASSERCTTVAPCVCAKSTGVGDCVMEEEGCRWSRDTLAVFEIEERYVGAGFHASLQAAAVANGACKFDAEALAIVSPAHPETYMSPPTRTQTCEVDFFSEGIVELDGGNNVAGLQLIRGTQTTAIRAGAPLVVGPGDRITLSAGQFEKGDVITANYRNSGRWFPGKIATVNADSTFNINFDDGDKESSVPAARMRRRGTAMRQPWQVNFRVLPEVPKLRGSFRMTRRGKWTVAPGGSQSGRSLVACADACRHYDYVGRTTARTPQCLCTMQWTDAIGEGEASNCRGWNCISVYSNFVNEGTSQPAEGDVAITVSGRGTTSLDLGSCVLDPRPTVPDTCEMVACGYVNDTR